MARPSALAAATRRLRRRHRRGDRRKFLGARPDTGYFTRFDTHGAKVVVADDHPNLREGPGVVVVREQLTPPAIRKLGPFDVALSVGAAPSAEVACVPERAVRVRRAGVRGDRAPLTRCCRRRWRTASPGRSPRSWRSAERVIARTPGYDASCERPLWVIRASQ